MRLLEIELRSWRGLDTILAGLSPRLNLVLGPNESGKSRIFEALRFGLFEASKGTAQHKQLLQSWTSPDSPFVRVVFAEGQVEYELQKQFLKGASAQLVGGGRTLHGEEAEESLRDILGARQGGVRGPDVAERGIWPLLMVSQGDSRSPVHEHLNEDGRGRLQERLSREIGVAAISAAGQRLMSLAEQEYGRYFTPTGQQGKALRDARAELRAAEAGLADATASLQRQEQAALALTHNRRELSELEARRAGAKHEADAARDRAEAAQAAGGRVATAQGAVNTAVQRVSSAREMLNTRLEADGTIERLSDDCARFELQLAHRTSIQNELERALQVAELRFGEGERSARETRSAMDALQRNRRREDLTAASHELTSRIAGLGQLEAAISAMRARRASLPMVDDAGFGRLKVLDQNARAAAAKLQGAAVSVVVHLRHSATVDGTPRAAGETVQIHVIENRRIAIGELADVEIRPGGGELDRLREAAGAANLALGAALRAAGADHLDGAAMIHAERSRCDQQIDELGKQVKATSAKSLAQLREDLLTCAADLERLGPASAEGHDEELLRAALGTADALLTQSRSERDGASGALAEFRSDTAALRASAQTTRAERDRVVKSFLDRPTATQLHAVHADAVAERDRAQVALVNAKREFLDLGGTEIQIDARRLGQAAESLASRVRELRSTGDQLQGELRTLMLAGHYEPREEAGAKCDQARSDLERLERQAAAAKRLWDVLNTERRRVVERLTAPVTLRVQPYLQDLFPGSTLDAGEGLDGVGLQSAQLKEPFAELSGGAQEQISLLTRIGIAEVLAADGTLPLVLDDALINTDPERIKRIHRLLFRAADNLQVILLSCHDVLFDGLGAEFVHHLQRRR